MNRLFISIFSFLITPALMAQTQPQPAASPRQGVNLAPAANAQTARGASPGLKSTRARPRATYFVLTPYYWQPRTGSALLPSFRYRSLAGSTTVANLSGTNTIDSTNSGYGLYMDYLYAFSEGFSAGLGINYGDNSTKSKVTITGVAGETEVEDKDSGLGDVELKLLGRKSFGKWALYYSLIAAISPGERTYDAGTMTGNAYSGGMSFQPRLGVHYAMGTLILGGFAEYSLKQERKTKIQNPESEQTQTGGDIIEVRALAELPRGSWTPGAVVSYAMVGASKSKTSGSTTDSELEGSSNVGFSAYAVFRLSPTMYVVPMLSYLTITKATSNGELGLSGLEGSIGARWLF